MSSRINLAAWEAAYLCQVDPVRLWDWLCGKTISLYPAGFVALSERDREIACQVIAWEPGELWHHLPYEWLRRWLQDQSPDDLLACALLRDIAGNQFRPFALVKASPQSRAIAKDIYQNGELGLLGVLADALEDEGGVDQRVILHLRAKVPHCRGCRAVTLVLDGEPGPSPVL